jgi:hypothetical protein
MIIFPPILTVAALGLVTVAGIFDEVKNSKAVIYLKLVDKIASQVNLDDMEWRKNLIHTHWNEYNKKQNKLKETPQIFVCPFSGISEEMDQPVLINR